MIVKWRQKSKRVNRMTITAETDKERYILEQLFLNRINLSTHLLLAGKENGSTRVVDLETEEAEGGVLLTTQQHL